MSNIVGFYTLNIKKKLLYFNEVHGICIPLVSLILRFMIIKSCVT